KVTAKNFYAFLPGRVERPEGWDGPNPPALMIAVPFESSGVVPGLANGASQAVQTATGLSLMRAMAASQPDRPVIFFFGGADSIQFRASREMFMALSSVPRTWREVLNDKDNGLV